MSFALVGCKDTAETNHDEAWPFPVGQSAHAGDDYDEPEEYIPDDIERWQSQHVSAVYGTVTRVEPVLDQWMGHYEGEEWSPRESCDEEGTIKLALRIHFQPQLASWPLQDGEEIVVGIESFRFNSERYSAVGAYMKTSEKTIQWSNDDVYFDVGRDVGFIGKFDKDGIFRTFDPMYAVDEDGFLQVPDKGYQDDWTHGSFSQLADRLHQSREDVYKNVYEDAILLGSVCPFNGPEDGPDDHEKSEPEVPMPE